MAGILGRTWWSRGRIAVAVAAVLLVAAGSTALGLTLWARSYAPDKNAGGYALSTRRAPPFRVAAHATTDLWVRLRVVCHPDPHPHVLGSYVSFGSVPLVYRYLGRFERTEDVGSPFAVSFKCREASVQRVFELVLAHAHRRA